jgi:hypothetical protein
MSHKVVIKVLSGILVVLFLCPSFISASLNPCDFGPDQGLAIVKSTNAHSLSDAQFLLEEKEAEDLIKGYQKIVTEYCFFVNVFSVSKLFISPRFTYSAFRSFGSATNLPVYLAKKALLI